jgi:3-hydroxyacyl-CoA dehydrogenase
MEKTTENIALVGSGLVGRGWAIVFARAGYPVTLYDENPAALAACRAIIADRLDELVQAGLLEAAGPALQRITTSTDLAEALRNASYVQESIPETVAAKLDIFRQLDELAPAAAVLASSSSAIPASRFTENLPGRARCLIAHPVNPPYLIPLVELIPAPWTGPDVLNRVYRLMEQVQQVPIIVKRELQGFILNRLQGALLSEAFRLVKEGYASTEDIDKTVRDGLGLRWSFMGPFETIDLNAPGGVVDYAQRYSDTYFQMQPPLGQLCRWEGDLLQQVESERRTLLSAAELAARQAWRDRRLMALAAHKAAAAEQDKSNN